ncbi:hypothetical protein H5410_021130, partial [Solanum commersonii]
MSLSRSKHSLGFRFHPSNKELINHLKRSMLDGIFPRPHVIKLNDVFRDLEPWQIIDGEKTCYFLTRSIIRTKDSQEQLGVGLAVAKQVEYFLLDEYIKENKNKDIFVICRIKEKKKEEEENNNDVKDEDVNGLVDPVFG